MSKSKEVIVNNTKANLFGFDKIVLRPGANKVPAEIWEKMKAHPVIKINIEEGILKAEEAVSEDKGLEELSIGDAVELAKTTIDAALLNKWFEVEKRKQVKSAIEGQLKKLNEPVVLRDGKKE